MELLDKTTTKEEVSTNFNKFRYNYFFCQRYHHDNAIPTNLAHQQFYHWLVYHQFLRLSYCLNLMEIRDLWHLMLMFSIFYLPTYRLILLRLEEDLDLTLSWRRPLSYRNQSIWTGFYMITAAVMKELNIEVKAVKSCKIEKHFSSVNF